MKTCSGCKEVKEESEFHKGAWKCKPCAIEGARKNYLKHIDKRKAYSREHYRKNIEKYRKYERERYQNDPEVKRRHKENSRRWDLENPQRVRDNSKKPVGRFSHAKSTARRRGLEWKIEKQDYINLVVQPCHYCSEITVNYGIGLDRTDNSKGYEIGNVVPCCGPCNQMRGVHMTVEEMKEVAKLLKKLRSQ